MYYSERVSIKFLPQKAKYTRDTEYIFPKAECSEGKKDAHYIVASADIMKD
jgi:hypothetical protein